MGAPANIRPETSNAELFFNKMLDLGFTENEASGLTEMTEFVRKDGFGNAVEDLAEKYLSKNIGEQRQIYSVLMNLYSSNHSIYADEYGVFKITALGTDMIETVKRGLEVFECERGVSHSGALEDIEQLMWLSKDRFKTIIDEKVMGKGFDHKKIIEALETDDLHHTNTIYHKLDLYEAGIYPENVEIIEDTVKGYDPRGWEGTVSDLLNGSKGEPIPFELDKKQKYPAWFGKGNMRTLVTDLEARDIKPAEVFHLIARSNSADIPGTKREFLAILSRLRHQNGVEYFGRYTMAFLKRVIKEDDSKKHFVVIFPKADSNNASYSEMGNLDQLAAQDVSISLYEAGSRSDYFYRLKQASKKRKIDTLFSVGHADSTGFQLSSDYIHIITGEASVSTTDLLALPAFAFNLGAAIILESCSAGKHGSLSFANFLQLRTGARVFANTHDGRLLGCRFDGSYNVVECTFRGISEKGNAGVLFW